MKKILFLLCIFIFKNTVAQQTWFKLLPGWKANNVIINKDTAFTMCSNFNNYAIGFVCNKVSLLKGNIYFSDSFFYHSNNLDEITNLEYRTPHLSIYNVPENKFLLGFNYGDSTEIGIKWHSAIFSYKPFKMLRYSLDQDTFDTKIDGLYNINGQMYTVVFAIHPISKLENVVPYSILKLGDDTSVTTFFTYQNKESGVSAHRVTIDKLSPDNQNASNLLLTVGDKWDWAGEPQSYQSDIVKMDTTGKVIWSCRPNLNWDSVNTTALQMVQKPNGNILCSWLDLYYRPWKRPDRPYQNADINTRATLWFAEIDYQTGKVLWNKNIRQFLGWKQKQPQASFDFLLMKDVKLMEDNTIVWAGQRGIDAPFQNGYKYMPFLLKTDLEGNPTWYREYDLYPSDTGDRGMQVYSFVQTPDKGFLLTGEYQNKFLGWRKSVTCALKAGPSLQLVP